MIEYRTIQMLFKEWRGEKPSDSYGGKAFIEWGGVPVFAEIAVVEMLKQQGYEGAVWVDTFRRCFRNAMPPAKCDLPEQVRMIYDHIVSTNGRRGGCWDVMAWNSEGVFFIECKRRGRDRMRENGMRWFAAAQGAGIPADRFLVCEWDIAA
jgi:hypothetical protein